ncbi:MAG: hypothetical protein COW71_11055 [Ignavibacteriales bacterium CG18_big_fil_WC_8_21_14_2_50_31_20]|nr:MAG: hypothetical protein COW71_11055 [Ignavibacteriales bacterium CG18_big_fil_WC_8_21_14_2_50_31_20]
MKKIIILLVIISSQQIFAQVEFKVLDSVSDNFKIKYSEEKHEYNPLHVGDVWQYDFGYDSFGGHVAGQLRTTRIVSDTIVNNKQYYKKIHWSNDFYDIEGFGTYWERNDNVTGNSFVLDVYDVDNDGNTDEELAIDSLELPTHSFYKSYKYADWLISPGLRNAHIIDSGWVIISFYSIPIDTVAIKIVEYSELFLIETIADRWGVIGIWAESPTRPLTGVIINGKQYGTIVSVEDEIQNSATFQLNQNYPNPFNPTTIISYYLSKRTKVKVKVFDILGNEVVELVNENQDQGYHEISFSAHNNNLNLSSGTYFYQLVTHEKTITKQMLLIK